jgi:arylsulfatase A-like enzyme
MEYTDAAVGRFLDNIKREPWFENTVVIILADHGFPLSEHGSSTIGYGLYTESVWIPFLMLGRHPQMGAPSLHDYPASQLDIAPTVLALAGIQEANHYLGHDLFRPTGGRHSLSYLVRGEQGSLEHGWFQHDSLNQQYFRIHAPLGAVPREQGNEVFNTLTDKPERKNIFDTHGRAGYDSLLPFLQAVAKLNTYAVEANVLWPDSSQPNSPSRAK